MRPHLFLPGLGSRRHGPVSPGATCGHHRERSPVQSILSTICADVPQYSAATRVCPPQPGLVRFNAASRHARSVSLSLGQRIAKLLTLLRAESRFSAVGTCALKPGMSADLAEGRHAQQRAAAMNGPAARNSKAIMAPSHAGLTGRPVTVFNGVRRSGGRVHGAEEISPLRVSVLRIAVRQAHTSNALIPAVPGAELSVGLGVGLGRRCPRHRCRMGTEVRERNGT
jgi:hypothetical protein